MFRLHVGSGLAVLAGFGVAICACAVGEISGSSVDGARDGFDQGAGPTEPAEALQCAGTRPDVVARNGWRSVEAGLSADSSLRFELKARPTASNLDGLLALGAESIDRFDEAAITVRFANDGLVDVRDGAFYTSDMAYPYEPGVWYSIGILADIDNQTYDVEIGPCGEPREKLIENASFRDSNELWNQLSTWAAWSSQTAALEVSTPTWMTSGGCVPTTCASLGHECGQPSDGCGGSLDCGGCGNTELCDSGLCVAELVTTPAPPSCMPDTCEGLGIECGVRSDGCGDYVACGDCPSGSWCDSGICIQDTVASSSPPPVCEPETCASLDRACGVASDGCGGALSCGSCQSGQACTSGGSCVAATTPPPACLPHTCQSLGRECGSVSDGCGGSLSCGSCQSGQSCNGGLCVQEPVSCEPTTCASLGHECGQPSDGCGSALSCGACGIGQTCSSGVCIDSPVPTPPPSGQGERPWADNTGPSNPELLSAANAPPDPIMTDGATYENFIWTGGTLNINADNVTLRNFRMNGSLYGIQVESGHRGIVIEDGEIYDSQSAAILGVGWTGRRLYVHGNVGDGIKIQGSGGPTVLEYSFIEKLGKADGAHADGVQSEGSVSNVTIRYNNFYMPYPGTPEYPGSPYKSNATVLVNQASNYVIENNWLEGGNYTIYCGIGPGMVIRNNLFGRYNAGYPGDEEVRAANGACNDDVWSGNRWDDSGELIP